MSVDRDVIQHLICKINLVLTYDINAAHWEDPQDQLHVGKGLTLEAGHAPPTHCFTSGAHSTTPVPFSFMGGNQKPKEKKDLKGEQIKLP